MELQERPWEALPTDLAVYLRDNMAPVAADILDTVRAEVPEYRETLDAPAGDLVRAGVQAGLEQFAGLLGRPGAPAESADFYRAQGRAALEAGRSLEMVQELFRVTARVAWHWMGRLALEANLPAAQMHLLAESIFVYIDELAAFHVEGYTEAATAAAGERSQRRGHLLGLLLLQPAADPIALRDAAAAASWPIPASLSAVALGPDEQPGELAVRIGPEVLGGSHAGAPCLLVADASGPGRMERVLRALADHHAAIGPATEPALASRSLEWARRTLELTARGPLAGDQSPALAEDHLADLVLAADEPLLQALAERRLGPLRALAPKAHRRLGETLLAWLEQGRSAPAAARVLHTHPQTVRYRLAQLRELLGDALDEPEARFELELALRGERLAGRREPAPV
jgi:hypothetical protein